MALDTRKVVAEAVALLDDEGLDGLSLRKLATRLGVRQPTLYWHIPSKSALITSIAETLLEQEFPAWPQPDPDQSWRSWLGSMCVRLRRALLAHRDGARVIAIAQLSTKMASFSELAMSTLVGRGLPLHRARVIVLTAERFTVGFVLEEQTGTPTAEDANTFDLDSYAKAYPTVIAGITEYFEPGRTVDDLYADCLALIIGGESEH